MADMEVVAFFPLVTEAMAAQVAMEVREAMEAMGGEVFGGQAGMGGREGLVDFPEVAVEMEALERVEATPPGVEPEEVAGPAPTARLEFPQETEETGEMDLPLVKEATAAMAAQTQVVLGAMGGMVAIPITVLGEMEETVAVEQLVEGMEGMVGIPLPAQTLREGREAMVVPALGTETAVPVEMEARVPLADKGAMVEVADLRGVMVAVVAMEEIATEAVLQATVAMVELGEQTVVEVLEAMVEMPPEVDLQGMEV